MARPKSDLQPRILHAAREHFLAQGVDGASLRAIAAEAGTTIGMVYYYFPAKDDLFLAVVEEEYAGLLESLRAALGAGGSVEEKLGRVYARLWSMSDHECTVVRLILREALVSAARVKKVVERFLRGHIPLLLGLLLEGRAAGELRDDQPELAQLIATIALGMMPVLAYRQIVPVARGALPLASADELRTALHEVLMRGLGAPSPRRTARRGKSRP
jgi:AcrR family transcriptional regulator